MSDIPAPGAGFVFMKVGTHARESLADIIERKQKEIDDAGYALWGYGGNTCHPLTMVQPFARDFVTRDGAIYLVMQPMESAHFAIPERAEMFSADGIHWDPIPMEINVRGSRYALKIDELEKKEFDLPLSHTRVAIGNSLGRPGDRYVAGRVDKACLEVVEDLTQHDENEPPPVHIGLVAHMIEPYAVLLRN
jgi:hypothetical protein